jgi:hypothetical protein
MGYLPLGSLILYFALLLSIAIYCTLLHSIAFTYLAGWYRNLYSIAKRYLDRDRRCATNGMSVDAELKSVVCFYLNSLFTTPYDFIFIRDDLHFKVTFKR